MITIQGTPVDIAALAAELLFTSPQPPEPTDQPAAAEEPSDLARRCLGIPNEEEWREAHGDAPQTLARQVREFRRRFGIHTPAAPVSVHSTAVLQHRIHLLIEEFFEVLAACGITPPPAARTILVGCVSGCGVPSLDLDFGALAQELADLDYVVEGFRQDLCLPGKPVADAVHAANMRKDSDAVTGLPVKLADWESPAADIKHALCAAGWSPHGSVEPDSATESE